MTVYINVHEKLHVCTCSYNVIIIILHTQRTVFNTLPSIHKILDKNAAMTARQTDLLQWVITPKAFTLCYKPISTVSEIILVKVHVLY